MNTIIEPKQQITRCNLLHEQELNFIDETKQQVLHNIAEELQLVMTGKSPEFLKSLVKFELKESPSSGEIFNKFYELYATLPLPIRLTEPSVSKKIRNIS